jgi:hypothetical protein
MCCTSHIFHYFTPTASDAKPVELTASGRKKRICRFPGCTNSIKSHGHCQTHGAKPKRCKVEGCQSQRQSGFDDMCKRHWNEIHKPKKAKSDERKVEPQGKSVYDDILPASFMWKNGRFPRIMLVDESKHVSGDEDQSRKESEYEIVTMMPLAKLLEDNASSEAGWHRRAENLARGTKPPKTVKCKLEEWEVQIAILEMALLVGIEGHSSGDEKWQRLLAHAWGRNIKDFRKHLVNRVCSRRGDMSRKTRSDAGTAIPEEKRVAAVAKANATKAEKRKKRKLEEAKLSGDGMNCADNEPSIDSDGDEGMQAKANGEETNNLIDVQGDDADSALVDL